MNMGYVDVRRLRPGHGVLYYEAENEYNHPWAMEYIMEQYHFHKLHEFMTLTEYLTMPAHMVKRILKGSAKGKADRAKWDEEKRKEAERLKKGNQFNDTSNPNMPVADEQLAEAWRLANEEISSKNL